MTIGSLLTCGLAEAGENPNIIVTTTEDAPINSPTGECTLRAAIESAQTQSAVDACQPGQSIVNIIGFASELAESTITLTEGQIQIHDPETLVIQGPVAEDPAGITIDGGGNSRLFDIEGGVQVGLKYLTLSGGRTVDGGYSGGGAAINARDTTLLLDQIVISGNRTEGSLAAGGAILAVDVDLSLANATITGNSTHDSNSRGGAMNLLRGQVSISDSNISNNSTDGAHAQGGGIRLNDSSMTLTRTQVTNNRTDSGNSSGGGLAIDESDVHIIESTIANNIATGSQSSGGGLSALFSDITLERSTVSINAAQGGGVHGGGVSVSRSNLEIRQSTLSGNVANGIGGGIYFRNPYDENYQLSVLYSTVAYNIAEEGADGIEHGGDGAFVLQTSLVAQQNPDEIGCSKQPDTYLYSVSTDAVCAGQAMALSDIGLQPLTDNGGRTLTHALGDDSVAIEAGTNCDTTSDLNSDQRGFPRPGLGSSLCDAGAFEAQPEDVVFHDGFINGVN